MLSLIKVFINEVCHAGTEAQVHAHVVNWDCFLMKFEFEFAEWVSTEFAGGCRFL